MARFFKVVSNEHRHNEGEIKLPTRATERSAGYDFYSPVDVVIEPPKSVMIWTDVKAHMYHDNLLLINVRSSMGKHPIMIANTQGWIDADYYENPGNDGNIGIRLFNLGEHQNTVPDVTFIFMILKGPSGMTDALFVLHSSFVESF